jgi:hypothetical protein
LTGLDGTVADVFASELVLGGVHNWLEVFANNHRTTCRLNPVNLLDTYNPEAAQLRDVYVVEKIGTKEGWSHPAADEEWQQGFYAGYVSAERNGQEVPVPVSALSDLSP